jgi:hypothetical protein
MGILDLHAHIASGPGRVVDDSRPVTRNGCVTIVPTSALAWSSEAVCPRVTPPNAVV